MLTYLLCLAVLIFLPALLRWPALGLFTLLYFYLDGLAISSWGIGGLFFALLLLLAFAFFLGSCLDDICSLDSPSARGQGVFTLLSLSFFFAFVFRAEVMLTFLDRSLAFQQSSSWMATGFAVTSLVSELIVQACLISGVLMFFLALLEFLPALLFATWKLPVHLPLSALRPIALLLLFALSFSVFSEFVLSRFYDTEIFSVASGSWGGSRV